MANHDRQELPADRQRDRAEHQMVSYARRMRKRAERADAVIEAARRVCVVADQHSVFEAERGYVDPAVTAEIRNLHRVLNVTLREEPEAS